MGFFDRFKKQGPPAKQTSSEKTKAGDKSLQEMKKVEGRADKKPEAIKKLAKENTGNAYKVLLRPVITEKSAILAEAGKYVFEVPGSTNKVEVARAVKAVYGVTPVKVNMIKLPGQAVVLRYKRFVRGQTKNQYKAIVTLKKGQKIPLFEGV